MRSRKEIESRIREEGDIDYKIELLLDIRDLLSYINHKLN